MIASDYITCDVCGQPKGATNHWYLVVSRPGGPGIAFGPISMGVDDSDLKQEHICGQACAHKRFSQWLASPTTERQA